jgi:nucleoside-diphosphate-sugar epimerase
MKKKILITGATGLLGSHMLECIPNDFTVYALGRTSHKADTSAVKWIEADLTEPSFCKKLPKQIDSIIHLAQSRNFRNFPGGASDVFLINTAATLRLLDYAATAGCVEFLYASTGGVYAPSERIDEHSNLLSFENNSFYPASKIAAENLLAAYKKLFRVVCLRYFFIYGRDQEKNMLIPRLISSVKEGKTITLSGENGFRFNPLYAEDAAKLSWALLQSNFSGIINVAGREEVSLRSLCEQIGLALNIPPRFEILTSSPSDFRVDLGLLEKFVGSAQHRFSDVVKNLI